MSEEQFKKSSNTELSQAESDICETHSSNHPSRVESCSPTGGVPMKKSRPDHLSTPVVPPSPPKTVSLDQLALAAKDFYRMSLAHEITMDSDFKLEPSNKDEEGLLQKVKETMHAAFWDLQRQKLEADPPDYSSALELLKEIKSSLVDMILPYQSSLRAQINDKLDVAAAEAQIAETGRFDLASYATPIIDIMATWCAPARDADVARLRDITDSVDFLKRVFEILEQMHMDLANFTIEKMRPYIRQHAAVYEREKFDQCLEAQKKAGVDGLSRTRQWLQEAFEKLCANTTTSPVLSSPCSSNAPSPFAPAGFGSPTTPAVSHPAPPPPTPNNILREAYLNLLTWDAENEFPETMLVDAGRFEDLSDCLTRTVTLASVILTVCNTVAHNYTVCLPSGQNSLPAGSITRLKETVSNDVRGIFDSTSARKLSNLIDLVTARVLAIVGHWRHRLRKDASTSLEDADRQWAALPNCDLPVELQDQLVKQVTAVLNGEHPVYNLMCRNAIPAKLLKDLAFEMAKPLDLLFRASFATGCLPSDWKTATTTPLFKKGSRASANNYRPASVSSICCKIMEKIIKKALMQFLEQNPLLSDAQHSFCSGRSCLTKLLFSLERWTKARDEGKMVHAIYIYFQKAFNSVPHQHLLYKLRSIGRCQRVQVGRQQPSDVTGVRGVLPGSVLGPTVFLVFTNDCVRDLGCDVLLFTGDIKRWKVLENSADEDHLQLTLNKLEDWALDFLRNALSARPPDPLTLPSGFGALSESGGPTGGTSKAVPSCDRLVAGGALRKTPFSAVSAPEGDAQIDLSRTYDLSIIASRLMPLVAHNRHVFGPHYAEIIQGLLLQNQSRGDLAVAPT
ncbi:unnamed protein product [Schistocephalus solidus]|uniref:Reverse transcriptase domain-containing protein n=1 Tax=Schistocephalus solidus TaxID=70667 RepID=A0A183SWZ5_SCHSO|nr:unnamed protein product [Schistocephalus solidus]